MDIEQKARPATESMEKTSSSKTAPLAPRADFSPELEKTVRRKLDWNIMPLIVVVYMLSVLDRSNIGNARIAGMTEDLNLYGNRYDWLLTIFYIPYIVFEWLTMCWKIFKPHHYASVAIFSWGLVATLQATTTSWEGMMACRFFLGLAECSFGPGLPLYLSYFYPRHEIGFRIGLFISGSTLANAYGGALAYGLSHIKSGIAPWRLLFILEGVPTCLVAIVIFFCLPDSPENCRFLNEEEKQVAVARAQRQPRSYAFQGFSLSQFFDAFLDYRSFFTALMFFGCNVSFASLPVFLPTIISELGAFSSVQSNGMSAPPYLLCFFVVVLTAWISDKIRMRGICVSLFSLVAAVGFILLATSTTIAVRYFAMFLCINIFVCVAIILAWVANNSATDSKRAGGFAVLQIIGQCGPVLGTRIFPTVEGPFYRKGMWICCGFCFLVMFLSFGLSYLLRRENKKRDEKYGPGSGVDAFDERVDAGSLGDKAPSFRYVI